MTYSLEKMDAVVALKAVVDELTPLIERLK